MADWEAFREEVLADLKNDASEFWDRLNDQQRPIVEQAARDLADISLLIIRDPDRRKHNLRTVAHIKGILEGEAAIAQLAAASRIKSSILNIVGKSLNVGLSLL